MWSFSSKLDELCFFCLLFFWPMLDELCFFFLGHAWRALLLPFRHAWRALLLPFLVMLDELCFFFWPCLTSFAQSMSFATQQWRQPQSQGQRRALLLSSGDNINLKDKVCPLTSYQYSLINMKQGSIDGKSLMKRWWEFL